MAALGICCESFAAPQSGIAPLHTQMAEIGEPAIGPQIQETPRTTSAIMPTAAVAASTLFYDHGQPTVYEQLMLEYINRARANPGAEAARLGIDLNQGLSPGTIANTFKAPLALHPLLIQAARDHSDWMLATGTFSHTGVGGSNVGQRISAAGYVLSGSWTWGENIAWGGSSGPVDPIASTIARHEGLFISPGHRTNLMKADFDEIGLGIRLGLFQGWNALMATQKFARSGSTPSPFAVGVAYYDFNGNSMYDPGEGIGGVRVAVDGAAYYTDTAAAGGYALPVPASGGTRQVTFGAYEWSEGRSVTFPPAINHKVDFVPIYQPPVLTGPARIPVGQASAFTISAVFGADLFRVGIQQRLPAATDSPTDLSRMVNGTTGGLNPISSARVHTGTHAYHLAHPTSGHLDQRLTYKTPFQVGAAAELRFYSRLGWATSGQQAQVRVSEDGGSHWLLVHTQAGSESAGEPAFNLRTVDLSAYAGKEILIQFRYFLSTGSFYSGTSADLGWHFDQVQFTDLLAIETLDEREIVPGSIFYYTPQAAAQTLTFQVTPLHRDLPWPAGPAISVTTTTANTYQSWAADFEASAGLPAGTIGNHPVADFNGDGLANALAFVFGLDPVHTSAGESLPHMLQGSDRRMRFVYRERVDSPFAIVPEISLDLQSWHAWNDPALPGTVTLEDHGVSQDMRTHHLVLPPELGPRGTARVRLHIEAH